MSNNPVPLPPPPKTKVTEIIRRYIKEDRTPNWRTDIPVFYELWKQYPSLDFWTRHELSYKLNTMLHFKTLEGAARLASDWAVFHYHPVDSVDTVSKPSYNGDNKDSIVPPAPPIQRRPRTIAQFIKNRT